MKLTKANEIDWETVDIEHDIDWDNIDFLTHEWREGGGGFRHFPNYPCMQLVIKRMDSIPQIGGLMPILAYQRNFLRYMKQFQGAGEAISSLDGGLLWDMSMTLARGGEVVSDVSYAPAACMPLSESIKEH